MSAPRCFECDSALTQMPAPLGPICRTCNPAPTSLSAEVIEAINSLALYTNCGVPGVGGHKWMTARCDHVQAIIEALLAAAREREGMREALAGLANAADRVGIQHFDSDDLSEEVEAMQAATQVARAALQPSPAEGV